MDEHREIKKSTQEIEMEAAARRPRVLTEIDPHSEWVHGREFDALVMDATGTPGGDSHHFQFSLAEIDV
jgi:hypothetical protein